MIGAGAFGCEWVKMLALCGISTSKPFLLTITDEDNIIIPNLNSHFLFRKSDVGKSKAERALAAGQSINNHLIIQSYKLQVKEENVNVFDDDFWEGLDIVISAVDNIKSKQYVDGRCVLYEKPWLELGSLGTKCKSQIIIPFLTQNYGETSDPFKIFISMDTSKKNFPYKIEHTIQWANDYFEENLLEGINECKKFIENPTEYLKKVTLELRTLRSILLQKVNTKISFY